MRMLKIAQALGPDRADKLNASSFETKRHRATPHASLDRDTISRKGVRFQSQTEISDSRFSQSRRMYDIVLKCSIRVGLAVLILHESARIALRTAISQY